eukprot:scaffold70601_cov32-Tisochrysis_lutea.AAC.2
MHSNYDASQPFGSITNRQSGPYPRLEMGGHALGRVGEVVKDLGELLELNVLGMALYEDFAIVNKRVQQAFQEHLEAIPVLIRFEEADTFTKLATGFARSACAIRQAYLVDNASREKSANGGNTPGQTSGTAASYLQPVEAYESEALAPCQKCPGFVAIWFGGRSVEAAQEGQ